MEKLDLKDRKIIYHLDIDSRQSFSQLGKKVGLSKDIVTYRVKKLQEKGIIKNFIPIIDSSRLGYNWYRFYFNFQYVSPDIRDEIAKYFAKEKYTHAVQTLTGHFDLLINTHVRDVSIAYFVWEDILSRYRDYFKFTFVLKPGWFRCF